MRICVAVLVLLIATPAWGSDLERLRGHLLPDTRATLEARVCAQESLAPAELRLLLDAPPGIPSDDSAGRIAACRQDPALIPLMVEQLVLVKMLSRRMILGLQSFERSVLARGIAEADFGFLASKSAHETAAWIHSITARELPPDALDAARPRVEAVGRRLFEARLDDPGRPLSLLQAENSDALQRLEARALAIDLAVLIETGEPWVVAAAIEIVRQVDYGGPALRAAMEARVAREPIPELSRRLAEWPQHPFDAGEVHGTVFPGQDAAVDLPERSWEVEVPRRLGLGLAARALLVALGALGVAIALAKRWPRTRRVVFPLVAVSMAPVALLVAEVGMAAFGVQPLAALRPMINPNQVEADLWQSAQVEGVDALVARDGVHRKLVFAERPDRPRVVVLGESSVHGHLLTEEEAFPALLAERLPDTEVLNAGLPGALSGVVLNAGLEALDLSPDLLVVYAGHNDLSHFPMMGEYRGWSRTTLILRRIFASSRVARVWAAALPGSGEAPADPSDAHLDTQAQEEAHQEALRQLGIVNARDNLLRLAHAAEERGVPMIIGVQALREDCSLPEFCWSTDLAGMSRYVAARSDAVLVDTQAAMEVCPTIPREGQPLNSCFYDNVHPSPQGHRVLAEALLPTVRELLSR